jgi:hypothetical protein
LKKRTLDQDTVKLRSMLKKAGSHGLTFKEMGDLAYAAEDALSDRGETRWHWEERDGRWVKVCVIDDD